MKSNGWRGRKTNDQEKEWRKKDEKEVKKEREKN